MTMSLQRMLEFLAREHPCDANGRLCVMERVPHFILARTTVGCVWRFRADFPCDGVRVIAKLAGREPPLAAPFASAAPPERLEPIVRVVREWHPAVAVRRDLLWHDAAKDRWELDADRSRVPEQAQVAIAELYRIASSAG